MSRIYRAIAGKIPYCGRRRKAEVPRSQKKIFSTHVSERYHALLYFILKANFRYSSWKAFIAQSVCEKIHYPEFYQFRVKAK
jgi:hypothetical protein